MEAGKIRLQFDASELFALHELARKFRTDVGSILRIGGRLMLEADLRGHLKMDRAIDSILNPPTKGD